MKKKAAKAAKKPKPAVKKAVKRAPAQEAEPEAPKVEPVALDDVRMTASDREHLEELCLELADANRIISTYKKDAKELSDKIKAEAKRLKLPPAVFTDEFKLSITKSVTKSIQATVLLSLGVSNAVIEKATKETPKVTLKITSTGDRDDTVGGGEE